MTLKAWRIERKWTQVELAEKIGTDQFTISRWEHGKHRPSKIAQTALRQLGYQWE